MLLLDALEQQASNGPCTGARPWEFWDPAGALAHDAWSMLGSLERFIGILIEHFAGRLPVWLAPTQAVVATIVSDADDYAKEAVGKLEAAGSGSTAICATKRSTTRCASIASRKFRTCW